MLGRLHRVANLDLQWVPLELTIIDMGTNNFFCSVRGEALIYGHPAGCRFISVAHIMVRVSSHFKNHHHIVIECNYVCQLSRCSHYGTRVIPF